MEYKEKSLDSTAGKLIEIFVQFDRSIGLIIHGEFIENGEFEIEYTFPFVRAKKFDYYEDIAIEKNVASYSFSAAFEYAPGSISIIFYLQNALDYVNFKMPPKVSTEVGLSGLSLSGKIILPAMEDEEHDREYEVHKQAKKQMIADAKNGDEEAIENLTFDEMDVYSKISKRVLNEDVLTIVNTSLMPYGIECDRYAIIGNILDVEECSNGITSEKIYNLTLECNEIIMNVVINKEDLFGIPERGRRFKGNVWLQGNINFKDA